MIRGFAIHGHDSGGFEYSGEFNRLSVGLNLRITSGMDGLMSSVGTQIQRTISEAINEQVLAHIQASVGVSSGQMTQK